MKKTKRALLLSVISLLACFAMLIGSTFAWFTDSVSSMNNIITSGNLDLKMYWTDDLNSGVWYDVEDDSTNTIFGYDNWEPGYTQVRYIKLVNAGSLALDYRLAITPQGEVGKLAEVITVHYAGKEVALNDRSDLSKLNSIGLLDYVMSGTVSPAGTLLPADEVSPFHDSGEKIVTLAMSMLTTAGNEYQSESVGKGFTITAVATQAMYETDSFGDDYDEYAEFPAVVTPSKVTVPVTNDNGVLAADTTMSDGIVSATLPAGVKLADGATEATLTVTLEKTTATGITTLEDELLIPLNVHIDGVAEDNTVPIIIDLGAKMPKGLNMGNYVLYHVENGVNNAMTYVADAAALNAHNQFAYDAATGNITVAMASFSEVAIVADTEAEWSGVEPTKEQCENWYYNNIGKAEGENVYYIANADELNIFSRIVGGMVKDSDLKDTFANKTVKLLTDINLADSPDCYGADHNITEDGKVFYPIGARNNTGVFHNRYNSDGTTNNVSGNIGKDENGKDAAVYSTLSSFEGTFDGNGFTIANFYQQTWEMFGDYNNGYTGTPNYYKDGMGLFGYVLNGTVKNLTVENFSSDGEFTPTGVIAAFADNSTFENIAIVNCNPRVYNTGNGGIVGIGSVEVEDDTHNNADKLTFKNITVDGTNKITALWGSWDVACGGLIGMFRGAGSVDMVNCHVAAQIDAYNDVCGNYQYYRYRYAGMLIGTNFDMVKDAQGRISPNLARISAENCTVYYENWNDYYYCELVENSLASYTHDHQFSRLTIIEDVSEIKKAGAWTTPGNFVDLDKDGEQVCYHIRKDANGNFYEHKHADSGMETVNGQQVFKEDHQIVYLPFNQLITGYGWGVEHVPVDNNNVADNFSKQVKVIGAQDAENVKKFAPTAKAAAEPSDSNFFAMGEHSLSDFFEASALGKIDASSVAVTVIPVYGSNENTIGEVKVEYTANTTNWEDGKLAFSGNGGAVYIIISDYKYCTPTCVKVIIGDPNNYASGDDFVWG